MDPELRAKLETLNFRPTGYGGMSVKVEDVRYTAVEHPLKGLAIIVEHSTPRSMTQFEVFVPANATIQQIAQVMMMAYEQIHPEEKS